MQGDPKPGGVYRQEYYRPGGALDQARVLGLGGKVNVPYGAFRRVLVTVEWSPVEPQLEMKYYRQASVRSRSGSFRAATSSSSS